MLYNSFQDEVIVVAQDRECLLFMSTEVPHGLFSLHHLPNEKGNNYVDVIIP